MSPGTDDWFVIALVPVQSRLYRYIASLVPVRADAEDLFQKSVLTAWQERQRFDPEGDLFAWLCGIARNHVRHHLRAQQRSRLVLDEEVVDQLADRLLVDDEHIQARQAALALCLDKLPARQRELVDAYYRSGSKIRDFAALRGLAVEALYKSLQRIRTRLETCISSALAGEAGV